MAARADIDDETLASPEEAALIESLRSELTSELDELKTAGCDFPHTTGDIFMMRVLRGCDRDLKTSVEWYRTFLQARKDHGLDALHAKFAESETPWATDHMPGAAEVRKYYNTHFDEARLRSSTGHLLWYDSVGNIACAELMKDLENFKQFFRALCERRCSRLDDLSREQGRLVKVVRILDCEGVTPFTVSRAMINFYKTFCIPLVKVTSAETNHRVFIINASWFAMKVIAILKPLAPERALQRVRILGRDYIENEELLRLVPVASLAELTATRGDDDHDDGQALEGESRLILAGKIMSKVLQVTKGQTVSWTFRMGLPAEAGEGTAARGLAGKLFDKGLGVATDASFSVSFWRDGDDTAEDSLDELVLAPATNVDSKMGDVSGSVEVPADGTLVLSWSNYSSWVRAKLLAQYKIDVFE